MLLEILGTKHFLRLSRELRIIRLTHYETYRYVYFNFFMYYFTNFDENNL